MKFNADWIPPENLEWFAATMSKNLVDVYERGRFDAKKVMQDKTYDLFKLIGLTVAKNDTY